MFISFSANKLISKNQSGFQPNDPCINQLLSITHKISTSFDNGLEVRSVFLDISKAFDKVWHEGLIFKFKKKKNCISGELLQILSNFLSNRKQRVVLNGQNSSWTNVHGLVHTSAKELNDDLKKVNDWAFQRKMSFNPDLSKQA